MSNYVLEVLNPRARREHEVLDGLSVPRLDTIAGKRLALISELPEGDFIIGDLQRLLREKYPTATVDFVRFQMTTPGGKAAYLKDGAYDAFIEGVRLTGGSNTEISVEFERRGIPGVLIAVEEMSTRARFSARAHGLPGLRIVSVPTMDWINAENIPERYAPLAEKILGAVIGALTDPLTEEEKNPAQCPYDFGNLCFEGKDYAEAYGKFLDYFMEHDLTDGLSVAPPTPEAVEAMLAGTSRAPDESIAGVMQPGRGRLTIRNIATNAVMAGAKPEYLPVIITAVEMVCDPEFYSWHALAAINSDQLVICVGGPIAKEIGMRGGGAFFAPGSRANNTIGRAVSLCALNGGWIEYELHGGMYGQATRITNLVFCENEELSPWESYPVSRGFSPEDSTVFVEEIFYMDGVFQLGNMAMPSGPWTRGVEKDLERISEKAQGDFPYLKVAAEGTADIHMLFARGNDPQKMLQGRTYALIIYPGQARQLAAAGYTRESLERFICDYNAVPWEALNSELQAGLLRMAEEKTMPGVTPENCRPGGKIPVMNSNRIAIFVAGHMYGQTLGMMCMGSYKGIFAGCKDDPRVRPFNIRKVTGATLTKAGR